MSSSFAGCRFAMFPTPTSLRILPALDNLLGMMAACAMDTGRRNWASWRAGFRA
jgi:hypothetical protein